MAFHIAAGGSNLRDQTIEPHQNTHKYDMDRTAANRMGALYLGGFGICLITYPEFFFGPNGVLPYFSVPYDSLALFNSR